MQSAVQSFSSRTAMHEHTQLVPEVGSKILDIPGVGGNAHSDSLSL